MTFYPLRVCPRQVNLVDGYNYGHLCGLGVVHGLKGLRHDPVIRSDDQYGDVGDLGAPGPDGSERRVARSVQEGYWLALSLHLVGADVLGYPANFTVDHSGVFDNIQKRGLPVVHMAKYGYHRRPGFQIGVTVSDALCCGFAGGCCGLTGQGGPYA